MVSLGCQQHSPRAHVTCVDATLSPHWSSSQLYSLPTYRTASEFLGKDVHLFQPGAVIQITDPRNKNK